MDETTYRIADSIFKVLAWLSVVCGGVWGWLRYVEQAKRDSQSHFREQQIRLYLESAEVVGAIAASEPSSAREEIERRFWTLYYGPLAVVQEAQVTSSLVDFADALRKGRKKTTLRTKSLAFSKACRATIEETWEVDLGPFRVKNDEESE
ncbi:MAG: hypothetical protein NXI30_17790 [bacterium]|nr:hypothetical protein [bacterium]